jgi:hypothetical protein
VPSVPSIVLVGQPNELEIIAILVALIMVLSLFKIAYAWGGILVAIIGYVLIPKAHRGTGSSTVDYDKSKKFHVRGPASVMMIAGGILIAVVDISRHGKETADEASLSARSIVQAAGGTWRKSKALGKNNATDAATTFVESYAEARFVQAVQPDLHRRLTESRGRIDGLRATTDNNEMRKLLDELRKKTEDAEALSSVQQLKERASEVWAIEFRNSDQIHEWSERDRYSFMSELHDVHTAFWLMTYNWERQKNAITNK